MSRNYVKKERLLLDSSLISTTFLSKNDKKTYNIKIIKCNNYIQTYYIKESRIKTINTVKKENNIKSIDTDNLLSSKNKKSVEGFTNNIEFKNILRSKLQCQRLAKCNSKDWETFITLTFAENITDISIANREFNKFISKIRRIYPELKYLCVPEFQKRGAVHYHVLTNINIHNEKLIFRQEDNYKFFHIKYWLNGFTKVDNIKGNIKKIIGYISKYMTKDIDDKLYSKHRYLYSQNLDKPSEYYLDITNEKDAMTFLKLLNDKELIYTNEYKEAFTNKDILFKEYLSNEKSQ